LSQVKAAKLDEISDINCNGAGDAFTSGFIVATMLRRHDSDDVLNIQVALHFASLVASRHICSSSRDCEYLNIDVLLDIARSQK
jgi:sugar/nucleoside kinase (ribokinase family)